jgi:hypothetical protein
MCMSESQQNIIKEAKNKGGRARDGSYKTNPFEKKPIRVISELIPKIRELESDFIQSNYPKQENQINGRLV